MVAKGVEEETGSLEHSPPTPQTHTGYKGQGGGA